MRGSPEPRGRRLPLLRHPNRQAGLDRGRRAPLVTPVWFIVEGDELVFNTGKTTAKGRAILRDPRLVICVDLQEPPFAFVQVQGTATVSEDPDELLASATAIGGRYMGAARAEEFGRRNGVPGELVVRLSPMKVIAELNVTD
jgi:PPOX class probable F420-dependent enzyme